MHTLLVGVGQEIITPPLGTMMMGYSPMRPALSVHDDLHVTAFAFQSGDTQALLLSADLCNIAFPQSEIRAAITAASGVPEEHIVISCTHTHSGPTAQNTELGAAYVRSVLIPRAESTMAVRGAYPPWTRAFTAPISGSAVFQIPYFTSNTHP